MALRKELCAHSLFFEHEWLNADCVLGRNVTLIVFHSISEIDHEHFQAPLLLYDLFATWSSARKESWIQQLPQLGRFE